MKPHVTRRELVVAAGATALTASVSPAWGKRLLSQRARVGPGRFRDGVASGDPSSRAVTFWSRLQTSRPRSGARLIVARDPNMRRTVATAVVPTGRGINGTLKARIGGLDPYSEYYYVWESGNDVSEIGRTRTRPAPDSAVPLRIACSSCQHYPSGYFSAHAHAAQDDVDLYVFLGDYVYERGRGTGVFPGREEPVDAVDLRTYRRKYAAYRADRGLRELHRLHPTVHIWDDHEVENNYTDNRPTPAALQRWAGYRAAFEWLPREVNRRDRYRIYKRLSYGATADVFLLDTRQYRTGQDGSGPRAMLGEEQMNWLIYGLRTSRARWKIVANGVAIAAEPFGNGVRPDKWDGFPADRQRLLGALEAENVDDVVFVSGDSHVFAANLLASDFDSLGDGSSSPSTAVEYVAGSVTSSGEDYAEREVQSNSPWVRMYNGRDHGYALLACDGERMVTEYRRSDISRPDGATQAFERFTQPAGANGFVREQLAAPPAT